MAAVDHAAIGAGIAHKARTLIRAPATIWPASMRLRAIPHRVGQRPNLLLLAPIAFLAVFYVVPLVLILFASLESDAGLTLARYREAFASPAFLLIIWRVLSPFNVIRQIKI